MLRGESFHVNKWRYFFKTLICICFFLYAQPIYADLKCVRSEITPPENFVGIQLLHAEDDLSWRIADDLNTEWVKIVIYWNLTETEQGKFDWKWSDLAFEQIRKHPDFKILLSINDTPAWLRDHEKLSTHYRQYLSHFLSRYRRDLHRLNAVEIFNEPNNPGYGWLSLEREKNTLNIPEEESAGLFSEVLKISNELIRQVAPHVLLVSGGLFSHENAGKYMQALFQSDIQNCIDIFGYHPYSHLHQFIEAQNNIQGYLKKLGVLNTPVWFTEYGTTDNGKRTETIKTFFNDAPELNAQIWFSDRDFGIFSDTYGLVDYFGKKKPEYALFKQSLQELRSLKVE